MAKLYFYYSAMNAGKSTSLLQSSYNYQERGMQTLLFTPVIDTRHKVGTIASRIGLEAPAITFDDQFNIYHHVKDYIESVKLHCVLIDEAQFLTKKQVKQLAAVADILNIPVLAYGIRSDFKGEPFLGSMYLLAWAEELIEIKTICYCGKKAIMNLRIDAEGNPVLRGQQIEIGGNDRYIATCRKHLFASMQEPEYADLLRNTPEKTKN